MSSLGWGRVVEFTLEVQRLHDQGTFLGRISPDTIFVEDGKLHLDLRLCFAFPFCGEVLRLNPIYAAPEVVRGAAPTAASDVFSLGAVVAFLARKQELPRLLDNLRDYILQQEELPHPAKLELLTATEPEPAHRQKSVDILAAALAKLADKNPFPYPEMIDIKGGVFVMGADPGGKSRPMEQPCRRVRLGSYSIARYPVTQDDYQRATRKPNPALLPHAPHAPVNMVSFRD